MTGATKVFKAFRGTILLRDHEVPRLQLWLSKHCALSAVFKGPRSVVVVGLKDQPMSSSSFARTIRGVLKQQLAIPTSGRLLGHWCSLISEQECLMLCTSSADLSATAAAPQTETVPQRKDRDDGGDVETITLPFSR